MLARRRQQALRLLTEKFMKILGHVEVKEQEKNSFYCGA